MNTRPIHPRSIRYVALAAALAAGSVSLAGCLTDGAPPSPLAAQSPLDQHPIPVAEAPEQLALGVHPDGLSFKQREALAAFVARWRGAGSDGITVQAPAGGPQAQASRTSALQTMDALMALGVPAARLRLVGYDAGPRPNPPILASFLKLEAEIPDCSKEWDNLTSTKENRPYRNYGCAVSANAAVQVANARDLVQPAPAGASDAGRRDVVLGKYRQGLVTSSAKDEQARGVVSSAVGSN